MPSRVTWHSAGRLRRGLGLDLLQVQEAVTEPGEDEMCEGEAVEPLGLLHGPLVGVLGLAFLHFPLLEASFLWRFLVDKGDRDLALSNEGVHPAER